MLVYREGLEQYRQYSEASQEVQNLFIGVPAKSTLQVGYSHLKPIIRQLTCGRLHVDDLCSASKVVPAAVSLTPNILLNSQLTQWIWLTVKRLVASDQA